MALAVPLSRFTPRAGGGSAFYAIVLFRVRSPAADSLVKPAVFGRSDSNSNSNFAFATSLPPFPPHSGEGRGEGGRTIGYFGATFGPQDLVFQDQGYAETAVPGTSPPQNSGKWANPRRPATDADRLFLQCPFPVFPCQSVANKRRMPHGSAMVAVV